MIMAGTRDAVIKQVQRVDIHGTHYIDIVYTHIDDQQTRSARLGTEAIYANPQPNDLVRVTYLMNVVTSVQHQG